MQLAHVVEHLQDLDLLVHGDAELLERVENILEPDLLARGGWVETIVRSRSMIADGLIRTSEVRTMVPDA